MRGTNIRTGQGRLAGAVVPLLTLLLASTTTVAAAGAQAAQAPPESRTVTITPGMSVQGRLSASDPKLDGGTSYDTYRFEAEEGRQYRVLLASPDFDTVLFVLSDVSGSDPKVWMSDDLADGITDSELIYTAVIGGTYEILVTSYDSGETGRYRLALTWTEGGMRNDEPGVEDPREGTGRRIDTRRDGPAQVLPVRN